ncbi:unnamed protein product, partial [Staurois parvus]
IIYIKYWANPQNHVIQVFQSPPRSQVYEIKPLGMQTASTNIGERIGRSQELSDSKRGPVIGCHLCNKSIQSIAKDLQTWCGLQISTTTVRRELHGMGFHG